MKTKVARILFGLSIAALPLVAPPCLNTALADDAQKGPAAASGSAADEASKHFRSGVTFYKSKDFAAAMVEFKRAYELVPNYTVLYNVGQTARELRDYALALTSYERYLREGDTKIPAARRKEVATSIEELRGKVGKIKVVTNVSGAEITVDDVTVGASPLPESLVVNIGRRKVSATLSGYVPVQRVLEVAGQEETTATLELTKIEPAKVPTSEPVNPPPPPPVLKTPTVVWVMLSATGALVAFAGVTGGLALSAHGGLQSELGRFPGDPAAIKSAQGKTQTFAITTDVLGGLALASAVTTTVLFLTAPKSPEKPKTTVGISPTGLVVQGTF